MDRGGEGRALRIIRFAVWESSDTDCRSFTAGMRPLRTRAAASKNRPAVLKPDGHRAAQRLRGSPKA